MAVIKVNGGGPDLVVDPTRPAWAVVGICVRAKIPTYWPPYPTPIEYGIVRVVDGPELLVDCYDSSSRFVATRRFPWDKHGVHWRGQEYVAVPRYSRGTSWERILRDDD